MGVENFMNLIPRYYIISGGRDYKDSLLVYQILDHLQPDRLVFGDCPTGVDYFAWQWCVDRDFKNWECFKADWKNEGKAAGPLRNREMCYTNADSILIAFPGGKGTASCIKEAKKLNIPVMKVDNDQ